MMETLYLSLYATVKIIKKDDGKNMVPIYDVSNNTTCSMLLYIDIQITWEFFFK